MKKIIIMLVLTLGVMSCEKEEINYQSFEIHEGMTVSNILNSGAFDAAGELNGDIYKLSIHFESIDIIIELSEHGVISCKANNINSDFYEVSYVLYEIYCKFVAN